VAISQSEFRAGDPPYLERPEVQAFIEERVAEGMDRTVLEELFEDVEPQQRILDLISRPAEARPWKDYRPIFVNDLRIERGREFQGEQAVWLERAEESFGVDQALIAAIIGVETNYGRNLGSFRVLDALVTLGFDYPPRQAFFRSELAHFLRLVEEEALDVRETRGSYAGAMGRGQLVPDPIILGMVGRRLAEPDCRDGCLLDGFPRTLPQAETLDDLLERQAMSVDGVIELAVPRDELVRRMLARQRADDDPEVFAKRITSFEVQTAPLLDYYGRQGKLASIDGLGTADEIFERVRQAVGRFRRRRR
jgi:adenylate kinase family enzyme